MICANCGITLDPAFSFCEDCGAPAPTAPLTAMVAAPQSHNSAPKSSVAPFQTDQPSPSNETGVASSLRLKTWVPFRWLFTTDYGVISISGDHFVFDLAPRWTIKVFEVISWIIYFGFNILGFFRANGSNQLKNVVSAGIVKPNWLFWNFNFMWVSGAGIAFALPITARQVPEADAFIRHLREASRQAKYETND